MPMGCPDGSQVGTLPSVRGYISPESTLTTRMCGEACAEVSCSQVTIHLPSLDQLGAPPRASGRTARVPSDTTAVSAGLSPCAYPIASLLASGDHRT